MLTGFALTVTAGGINAVGLLAVHHQALSHLTGIATQFSMHISRGAAEPALGALGIIAAFFFGSLISGMFVRRGALKIGRRYGAALMLESGMLVAATYMLRNGHSSGDLLATMACGLQNGLATSYAGAIIRTSHMTGIVTDLGLSCAHWLRGMPGELPRLKLHAVLLGGFIFGGVIGTAGFALWGYDTLFIPAAVTGIGGGFYMLWKHAQRAAGRAA